MSKSEEELKIEFYEFFGKDMLDRLSEESTVDKDLVELLWLGFLHGYKACETDY